MSSSYHHNHGCASPAFQVRSNGTLEMHTKRKKDDDPDAANPSPNISGDAKHHEEKDEYKLFPRASPLEKGVGGFEERVARKEQSQVSRLQGRQRQIRATKRGNAGGNDAQSTSLRSSSDSDGDASA